MQKALEDRSPPQSLPKEVVFFAFSGTGNTLRASEWSAEDFRERGVEARVIPLESVTLPDDLPGEEGLIVLASATHGFTTPWKMIRFASALPPGQNRRAAVITTRAGLKLGPLYPRGIAGTSGFLMSLLLFFRGYRPRGVVNLDMPSNWFSLHPPQGARSVNALLARARPRMASATARWASGRRLWASWSNLYEMILGLALLPISLIYLSLGRFALAKLFFANTQCNGCGICARSCPVGALHMRGRPPQRPYWDIHCESCMRCAAVCPQSAVEASHSWFAVVLVLTSTSTIFWVLDSLSELVGLSPVSQSLWVWPFYWVIALAAVSGAYYVLWGVTRIAVVNRLFELTTLTHLWGRYREPRTSRQALSRTRKQRR